METYHINTPIDPHELVLQNDKIIKLLMKSKKYKINNIPKYIIKNNEIINRLCDKRIKKSENELNKLENQYDYVETVDVSDISDKYVCCALTKNYKQCKQNVKYTIKNINKENEKCKYKYNVFFCTSHLKQMLNSSDKRSLKHGFYFDSDIYIKA